MVASPPLLPAPKPQKQGTNCPVFLASLLCNSTTVISNPTDCPTVKQELNGSATCCKARLCLPTAVSVMRSILKRKACSSRHDSVTFVNQTNDLFLFQFRYGFRNLSYLSVALFEPVFKQLICTFYFYCMCWKKQGKKGEINPILTRICIHPSILPPRFTGSGFFALRPWANQHVHHRFLLTTCLTTACLTGL